MRSLKILTCNILVSAILWHLDAPAQPLSFRFGVYDFTDNTAREFYVAAPLFLAGYDAWKKSRLSLEVSTGLAFNGVKYNDHRHYLYMVPLMATVNYDLVNPGSKIWPVFGIGMSLMGKADHNRDFQKTHYSLTYGYQASAGLNVKLKNHLVLIFNLSYNLMMVPVPEELDISGVMVTFGIRIPVKRDTN